VVGPGGFVFTIDYVTSGESDQPVEQVEFDGRTLEGAAALAESVLRDIVAGTPRGSAAVIGYLIRDEGGKVVRRLYKGLG
jgi:hypothetical protein